MDQLRIVVGFKVTPDYEALRPADWARAAADGRERARRGRPATSAASSTSSTRPRWSSRCACATRARRRGLETSLAAFSVAGREADPFLRTLQALGYEARARGARARTSTSPLPRRPRWSPPARERLGGDVLLLGARSGPGDSGVVPFLAAEALGRPCLTAGRRRSSPPDDGRLRVTFAADDGPVRATVTPPCVLAVGNAVVSMLRVPTLKDRLAVRDQPVAELSPRGPRRGRRRRALRRAGRARGTRDDRPRAAPASSSPARRRRTRRARCTSSTCARGWSSCEHGRGRLASWPCWTAPLRAPSGARGRSAAFCATGCGSPETRPWPPRMR